MTTILDHSLIKVIHFLEISASETEEKVFHVCACQKVHDDVIHQVLIRLEPEVHPGREASDFSFQWHGGGVLFHMVRKTEIQVLLL